jgi:epsilon-lactone hydrolase
MDPFRRVSESINSDCQLNDRDELVLLDDAVRLARQAAIADVDVTLDITPRVPHVFHAYYPILDEAAAALDRAGQLLSAHLAGAKTATA